MSSDAKGTPGTMLFLLKHGVAVLQEVSPDSKKEPGNDVANAPAAEDMGPKEIEVTWHCFVLKFMRSCVAALPVFFDVGWFRPGRSSDSDVWISNTSSFLSEDPRW